MKQMLIIFSFALFCMTANAQRIQMNHNFFGEGGEILIHENGGAVYTFIQPDLDGEGGYLQINRSSLAPGFSVNGNNLGTMSTRVDIGGATPMIFDASSTGNTSVVFGTDAINSTEIENEVGATSENEDFAVSLTGSLSSVLSKSIDAPTSGYVLVIATARIELNHTNGILSYIEMGLSENGTSLNIAQDLDVAVPSGVATGIYNQAFATHAIYDVAAGVHTFHLIGREISGVANVADINLSCIFIPTAYGTVEFNLDDGSNEVALKSPERNPDPLSVQVKESEAAALKANQERMAKEIAELKAMLESMKIDNNGNGN